MAVVIPEELFDLLNTYGKSNTYPSKTKIFTQGDIASHFYIVAKGRVRVYSISSNGKERTIEILEKGRIFGDSSFLTNTKRAVSIETVVESEIIQYRAEELINMCANSHELMKIIFQHMADTCDYLTHQIIQSNHYTSVQKVADFLLNESARRKQSHLPYTHEEIAASTSLNRVTVSRILSGFQKDEAVIIKYKNIEICNKLKLKSYLL